MSENMAVVLTIFLFIGGCQSCVYQSNKHNQIMKKISLEKDQFERVLRFFGIEIDNTEDFKNENN